MYVSAHMNGGAARLDRLQVPLKAEVLRESRFPKIRDWGLGIALIIPGLPSTCMLQLSSIARRCTVMPVSAVQMSKQTSKVVRNGGIYT